jgi:hypothetical protein
MANPGKWHLLPRSIHFGAGDYEKAVRAVHDAGFTRAPAVYASNLFNAPNLSHNPEWCAAEANAAVSDAISHGEPFFLCVFLLLAARIHHRALILVFMSSFHGTPQPQPFTDH